MLLATLLTNQCRWQVGPWVAVCRCAAWVLCASPLISLPLPRSTPSSPLTHLAWSPAPLFLSPTSELNCASKHRPAWLATLLLSPWTESVADLMWARGLTTGPTSILPWAGDGGPPARGVAGGHHGLVNQALMNYQKFVSFFGSQEATASKLLIVLIFSFCRKKCSSVSHFSAEIECYGWTDKDSLFVSHLTANVSAEQYS